jgi:hypothetical protein
MTPTELIKLVQDAPGSLYTREDVISLLNRVEAPAPAPLSEKAMELIIEEVSSVLDDLCWEDVVEKEYQCDTYGSEATINCEVTIDVSDVTSKVEKALKDLDLSQLNEDE